MSGRKAFINTLNYLLNYAGHTQVPIREVSRFLLVYTVPVDRIKSVQDFRDAGISTSSFILSML